MDTSGTPHVAIVTGASRGIGRAIAVRLAAEGVKVLVTARSLRPGSGTYTGSLQETVDEIRALGGDARPFAVDLADTAFDRSAIVAAAADAFGAPVDIVVHNAAAQRRFEFTFESMTADIFRESVEVNVWAGWDLAQKSLRGMRDRGAGWIVFISSRGAAPKIGPPYVNHPQVHAQCLYGSSKAMMDRLVTGAASELYDDNIAVNALAPEGAVATDNAMKVASVTAAMSEPLETMAEATFALCSAPPREFTGRVTYSLSLLVTLGRPVMSLDGREKVAGWQPDDIDRSRLGADYLVGVGAAR
ncbi:MAG: SDR family NAD(P)-dependent oxidoreductase [Acidimicrobiia bacterium]